MRIVGGLDVHRRQITFDYLDERTGQSRRGRIAPADRLLLRHWLETNLEGVGCVKDLGQVLGWSGRGGRRGAVVGERFERCAVAERGMQSSAVVEDLDVFGDGEPRPGSGSEGLPVVHLVLQGGEE
jgi:hypothetical protein